MIRHLLQYCSPRARRLVVTTLTLSTVAAFFQGLAFLLLVPVLRCLFVGNYDDAWTWLIAVLGTTVGYVVASWFAGLIGKKASTAVLDSLLERLGDTLVSLPVSWFATDRTGMVTGLATQGAKFCSTVPYTAMRKMNTGLVAPATVLVGMFVIDWRLALAMAVAVPVIMVGYRWLNSRIGSSDKKHAHAVDDASNRVVEFARTQPALRTAGEGSIADRLVAHALEEQHRHYRGLLITGGAAFALFTGLVQLSVTLLITVGAFLAVGGTADIATVLSLLVLGVRFNEPIAQIGDLGSMIAVARNTLDRLDEFAAVPRLTEPEQAQSGADFSIELRNVTFGYGGKPVLRGLSFTAPAGRMTAIIGPSGSGKTTITKLIARFYDPESGTVLIGGVPLPELGTETVESAVAPVFQDVYLFDDTIINNVWIGNPDRSRDEVVAAATRARVDEIVDRLPGGWDARVGEAGSNLSGGERQRISVARALLKDAPIVVLDEATSALDIGNEIAIGEAIDSIRADRTLIVVAHRLQTIMTADQIIMLNDSGGIHEIGSHAELLAKGGAYARYWAERTQAADWQLT